MNLHIANTHNFTIFTAPVTEQINIATHILSAISFPFKMVSNYLLSFIKSDAGLMVEVEPESKHIMVTGNHINKTRVCFIFTNTWNLVETSADVAHFNMSRFNTSFTAIESDKLTNKQIMPPTSWLQAVSVLVPDIRDHEMLEKPMQQITADNYVEKMRNRLAIRERHRSINVDPEWSPSDAWKDIIFNYRPWVLDNERFTMENVCLCCTHGCPEDYTSDLLNDGFDFHYCWRNQIWYMLIDSTWIPNEVADEMMQNQAFAHQKFQNARTVFTSAAYMATQAATKARYPDIEPEHPSNVMLSAGGSRRPGSFGNERYTPELRSSCCEAGKVACTRVYNVGTHRRDFVHAYPVNNSYIGLNYLEPVKINVNTEFEWPVTSFNEEENAIETFRNGCLSASTDYYDLLFSSNVRIVPNKVEKLLARGRTLEDVDVLPNFLNLIPNGVSWADTLNVLNELMTPEMKLAMDRLQMSPEEYLTRNASAADCMVAIARVNGQLQKLAPIPLQFVKAPEIESDEDEDPEPVPELVLVPVAAPAPAPAPVSHMCQHNVHCRNPACQQIHWPTQICRHDGQCSRFPEQKCWFLHRTQTRHQIVNAGQVVNIRPAGIQTLPRVNTRPGLQRR